MSIHNIYTGLKLIPFPSDKISPGRLYRNSAPYPEDLDALRSVHKITKIVQLCSDEELCKIRSVDLPKLYREMGFKVTRFPIKDFSAPKNYEETRNLADEIIQDLQSGENIVIHCHAGNGRTGMVIACLARKILGVDGAEALKWVRQYIPRAANKEIQRSFVMQFLEGKGDVSTGKTVVHKEEESVITSETIMEMPSVNQELEESDHAVKIEQKKDSHSQKNKSLKCCFLC